MLAIGGRPTFEIHSVGGSILLRCLCQHYIKGHKTTWKLGSHCGVRSIGVSSGEPQLSQLPSAGLNSFLSFNLILFIFPLKMPLLCCWAMLVTMFSLQKDCMSGMCCKVLECFMKKEKKKENFNL